MDLMHKRAAKFLLYDDQHRFLLQHRTEDAVWLPGHWGFFGGEIDPGEGPEEAVKREALEETGYPLRNPLLVLENNFVLPTHSGCLYVFIESYDNLTPIILGEGQGFGWFSVEGTKKLKMVERDWGIIDYVEQYLKRSDGERSV